MDSKEEGEKLFQQLCVVDPTTQRDDYFNENTWDLQALKDDIELSKQAGPIPTDDSVMSPTTGFPTSTTVTTSTPDLNDAMDTTLPDGHGHDSVVSDRAAEPEETIADTASVSMMSVDAESAKVESKAEEDTAKPKVPPETDASPKETLEDQPEDVKTETDTKSMQHVQSEPDSLKQEQTPATISAEDGVDEPCTENKTTADTSAQVSDATSEEADRAILKDEDLAVSTRHDSLLEEEDVTAPISDGQVQNALGLVQNMIDGHDDMDEDDNTEPGEPVPAVESPQKSYQYDVASSGRELSTTVDSDQQIGPDDSDRQLEADDVDKNDDDETEDDHTEEPSPEPMPIAPQPTATTSTLPPEEVGPSAETEAPTIVPEAEPTTETIEVKEDATSNEAQPITTGESSLEMDDVDAPTPMESVSSVAVESKETPADDSQAQLLAEATHDVKTSDADQTYEFKSEGDSDSMDVDTPLSTHAQTNVSVQQVLYFAESIVTEKNETETPAPMDVDIQASPPAAPPSPPSNSAPTSPAPPGSAAVVLGNAEPPEAVLLEPPEPRNLLLAEEKYELPGVAEQKLELESSPEVLATGEPADSASFHTQITSTTSRVDEQEEQVEQPTTEQANDPPVTEDLKVEDDADGQSVAGQSASVNSAVVAADEGPKQPVKDTEMAEVEEEGPVSEKQSEQASSDKPSVADQKELGTQQPTVEDTEMTDAEKPASSSQSEPAVADESAQSAQAEATEPSTEPATEPATEQPSVPEHAATPTPEQKSAPTPEPEPQQEDVRETEPTEAEPTGDKVSKETESTPPPETSQAATSIPPTPKPTTPPKDPNTLSTAVKSVEPGQKTSKKPFAIRKAMNSLLDKVVLASEPGQVAPIGGGRPSILVSGNEPRDGKPRRSSRERKQKIPLRLDLPHNASWMANARGPVFDLTGEWASSWENNTVKVTGKKYVVRDANGKITFKGDFIVNKKGYVCLGDFLMADNSNANECYWKWTVDGKESVITWYRTQTAAEVAEESYRRYTGAKGKALVGAVVEIDYSHTQNEAGNWKARITKYNDHSKIYTVHGRGLSAWGGDDDWTDEVNLNDYLKRGWVTILKPAPRSSESMYLGVKKRGKAKYSVLITMDGRTHSIGSFTTQLEAAHQYDSVMDVLERDGRITKTTVDCYTRNFPLDWQDRVEHAGGRFKIDDTVDVKTGADWKQATVARYNGFTKKRSEDKWSKPEGATYALKFTRHQHQGYVAESRLRPRVATKREVMQRKNSLASRSTRSSASKSRSASPSKSRSRLSPRTIGSRRGSKRRIESNENYARKKMRHQHSGEKVFVINRGLDQAKSRAWLGSLEPAHVMDIPDGGELLRARFSDGATEVVSESQIIRQMTSTQKLFTNDSDELVFEQVQPGDYVLVQWKEDRHRSFAWWQGMVKSVHTKGIKVTFPRFKGMPEYENAMVDTSKKSGYKNKTGGGYLGGIINAPKAVTRRMNMMEAEHSTIAPVASIPVRGSRIKLFWPTTDDWFEAKVLAFDADDGCSHLEYTDGQNEWVDLNRSKWNLISSPQLPKSKNRKNTESTSEESDSESSEAAAPPPPARTHVNQRSRKGKAKKPDPLPRDVALSCQMNLSCYKNKKPKRWDIRIRCRTHPGDAEINEFKGNGAKAVKYDQKKMLLSMWVPTNGTLSFFEPGSNKTPATKRKAPSNFMTKGNPKKAKVATSNDHRASSRSSISRKKRARSPTPADETSEEEEEEEQVEIIEIKDTKSNPNLHTVVGRGVSIYWEDSNAWYAGKIQGYDMPSGKSEVIYYDGVVEWLDLNQETAVFVEDVPSILHASSPSHSDLRQAIRKHRAEAKLAANKAKTARYSSDDEFSGSESSTTDDDTN